MDMSSREPGPAAPTQSGAVAAPKASTPDGVVARSFAILLGFQCLGELIAYVTRVPVPGSVPGMVLFLCLLSAKPSVMPAVEQVSCGLLNYLSLFIVPAGVGVMVRHIDVSGFESLHQMMEGEKFTRAYDRYIRQS